MLRTQILFVGVLLACSSLTTGAAAGDPHAGDIEVGLFGNQLVTDGLVFESEFNFFNGLWVTDDPGFEGDAGVFVSGTTIGFNIMSALGFWNGNGFDDLDPFNQESMTLEFGPLSATTGAGFVNGFNFVANAGPGFDTHLDFTLNGAGGEPADGVYLLSLQLTSNNYLASETLWIVFGKGVDEKEIDLAMDWVERNLVPAPSAMLALALGGLGLRRRRRE